MLRLRNNINCTLRIGCPDVCNPECPGFDPDQCERAKCDPNSSHFNATYCNEKRCDPESPNYDPNAHIDNCNKCVEGATGLAACSCNADVRYRGNVVYLTHTDCSVKTYCGCCNSFSCTMPGRCGACVNVQNGIFDMPCITSNFGSRNGGNHNGIDLVTSDGRAEGTPIYSPVTGVIVQLVTTDPSPGTGGGVRIRIVDEERNSYYFMHLQTNSNAHLQAAYEAGATIQAGSYIGNIGHTGHCVSTNGGNGAHLHYEIYDSEGNALDPLTFDPNISNIQSCY